MKMHTSMHAHMHTHKHKYMHIQITCIKNWEKELKKKQNPHDMINSFPMGRSWLIVLSGVEPDKWSSYLPVLFRGRRKEG